MSDQHREASASVEPLLRSDTAAVRRRSSGAAGLRRLAAGAAPAHRELRGQASCRQRYVTRLDHTIAEQHFRRRSAVAPGGLAFRAAHDGQSELTAAQSRGDIVVETDDADQRVTVRWNDASFGEPVVGAAVARPGYGGIVLGPHATLQFDPQPLSRSQPEAGRTWPLGDAVEKPPASPPEVARVLDAFFARSTGAYGILIATPERIRCERYSEFGAAPPRAGR